MPNKYAVDKQEIILIHGWGNTASVFEPLQSALAQSAPGRYAFDAWCLPGHDGDTQNHSNDLTVEQHLEFLLETWAARLPPTCILIGWSLGGMIAAALAKRVPNKVRAFICLAASPSFVAQDCSAGQHSWPHGMTVAAYTQFCENFAASPLKTWRRFQNLQILGDRNTAVAKPWQSRLPAPTQDQLAWWQAGLVWLKLLNYLADLPSLVCPSLHVFGEADQVVPVSQVEDLKTLVLGARHHKVKLLEDASHLFPYTQADALAKHIERFIRTLSSTSPEPIPKHKIASSFGRAAVHYDDLADVQYRCAAHLMNLLPESIAGQVIDLGAGTAKLARLFSRRFENASASYRFLSLDISHSMLSMARSHISDDVQHQVVQGDMEALPFRAKSASLVLSNFALQWCGDLQSMVRQVKGILSPGGEFVFTILGPNTLYELKDAWAQVDDFVHVNTFADIEALEKILCEAGFVIDTHEAQEVVALFDTLIDLLRSLKGIGARNMNAGQPKGLTTPGQLKKLEVAFEPMRNEQALLPLSYDVHFFRAKLK